MKSVNAFLIYQIFKLLEYFLISRKLEFLISANPTFLILRIIFIDIKK